MTRFSNIGEGLGMMGIFVSGMRAAWLIAAGGAMHIHQVQCDGPVVSMTPFHNDSCVRGFITIAGLGAETTMRICEAPALPLAGSVLQVDEQWVTRKVPLRSVAVAGL